MSQQKRLLTRPVVIAHRGASGHRPEHTLAGYELAARMGADFIEPDLVATKDGVLVARHESEISRTTDVARRRRFADRYTRKVVDGVRRDGWFTEDFTLAELKSLRAVERMPDLRPMNSVYDDRFEVPTLEEVLDLRARLSVELGRPLGVYPELKHPTYFAGLGVSVESVLVSALRRYRLDDEMAPVVVQCFEFGPLQRLRERHGLRARLVLLTSRDAAPYDLRSSGSPCTYADLTSPTGLDLVSTFADGIGPEKSQVIPRLPDGRLGAPTQLMDHAHDAGLTVHVYTFRAENAFLPLDYRRGPHRASHGDVVGEQLAYLHAGVDGLFTDHVDASCNAVTSLTGARA